ncbi:MAG: DUF6252 family protein [Segetibacter sp.]
MKRYLYLLLFISISFFPGCKKNKPAIDQLPLATQTGAGTFGCLVDGKVFKPKGSPFAGPILSCAYQYINDGYSFQLKARQDIGDETLSVGLFTDSLAIAQGQTIKLFQNSVGKAYGQIGKYKIGSSGSLYYTIPTGFGEIKITKFDETNRIVSGTFWFDAINSNSEKVQVREGRFDMHYTL